MKTFSIITPVYNGQAYIDKCILSIAKSDYDLTKIEHIIVDDGSSDRTKEICLELANKYPHVKYFEKQNGNWGSVINYVKNNKLVHNDYVVVCDADDVILSNAFKTINEKCNDADYCSASFYLWDGGSSKRKVHSYYFLFKRHMHKRNEMSYYSPLLLPHSSYIKKEIFYAIPDLKEHVSYQDNILYLEAFRKALSVVYIPKPLSLYWQRRAGNTMSNLTNTKGLDMQVDNLMYYASRNKLEPFFYVLVGMKHLRKYLKEKKLTFNFDNPRLDLTGFPFYVRPILRLMYVCMVKKFVKKN